MLGLQVTVLAVPVVLAEPQAALLETCAPEGEAKLVKTRKMPDEIRPAMRRAGRASLHCVLRAT